MLSRALKPNQTRFCLLELLQSERSPFPELLPVFDDSHINIHDPIMKLIYFKVHFFTNVRLGLNQQLPAASTYAAEEWLHPWTSSRSYVGTCVSS